MSPDVEEIGAPFDGSRYELLGPVGGGGMGRVYLARHIALQGEVAVKVLHTVHAGRADLADRMRLEGQALAQLKDPNVVQIFDAGYTSTGRSFLVMERLVGRTVWEEVVQRGSIPLLETLDWTRQALLGLSAAHSAGIVHRDVKPSNLFLCDPANDRCDTRTLKLIDFGIAKLLDSARDRNGIRPLSQPTTEGHFVGTPVALSPEQARGDAVDHRADLYSTGLVLYRLVTGRHPFGGLTGTDLLRAYRERDVPPPSGLLPDIDPGLERVLLKALQSEPDARFQSAVEFAEQLAAVEASLSTRSSAASQRPHAGAGALLRAAADEPSARSVDSQAVTRAHDAEPSGPFTRPPSQPPELGQAPTSTSPRIGGATARVPALHMATEPVPGMARQRSGQFAVGAVARIDSPAAFASTEPTEQHREPTVLLPSGDNIATRTACGPGWPSASAKGSDTKRSAWSFLLVLCLSAATVSGLLFLLLGK